MGENKKQGRTPLKPDDLEQVIGGAGKGNTYGLFGTEELYCDSEQCKQVRKFYIGTGGRATCSVCHKQIMR